MNYYFAPMEGLTDSVYRRVHHTYFPGIHTYYMPFLSPTMHRTLTQREKRELPRADSVSFRAVPQILTKISSDFIWAAEQCAQQGYDEVNLNLGCPSGTVTAKGKGSGMLRDPDGLDRFLDEIFHDSPLPISVKTRLGFASADEFPRFVEIFNRYPIKELTLHPRVRQAFYAGDVDMESFRYLLANTTLPVCYNGNLNNVAQISRIQSEFPQVGSVMMGRGLIGDPGMLTPGGTTLSALESFMDTLLEEYCVAFGSVRNAMFRLKENWRHLLCLFDNSDKLGKQLRKTTDEKEYRQIVTQILRTLPMRQTLQPDW